jgi:hypothetical protein
MTDRTLVRCVDRTVFEVDSQTLEPKGCSVYDAYCYTNPESGVRYIEHAEWCMRERKIGGAR